MPLGRLCGTTEQPGRHGKRKVVVAIMEESVHNSDSQLAIHKQGVFSMRHKGAAASIPLSAYLYCIERIMDHCATKPHSGIVSDAAQQVVTNFQG